MGAVSSRLRRPKQLVDEEIVDLHEIPPEEIIMAWRRHRYAKMMKECLSFMPYVIMEAARKKMLDQGVIVHTCQGALVFCDASGFTKLTETLSSQPNGAELLSASLTKFFTPLIDLIHAYRGDVIKFSGDALMVMFEAQDDYEHEEYPCGSPWADPRIIHTPMSLAILRSCACCIEIRAGLRGGGGVGMGVSGMVFVGLVLGCIEAKFCK